MNPTQGLRAEPRKFEIAIWGNDENDYLEKVTLTNAGAQ